MKKVTITLEEDVLKWARKRAAEENTSVSRLLGDVLKREMRRRDSYWRAYESWKKLKPWPIKASDRWTREGLHERRR